MNKASGGDGIPVELFKILKDNGITYTMDMGLGGLQELVMDRKAWHAAIHVVSKSWTRLSD